MNCIPPWLSSENQCSTNVTIKYKCNHTWSEIRTMIEEKFITPKLESELTEAEKKCKKPCMKMTNKISLRAENDLEYPKYAELILKFRKEVIVKKQVVVYTWFNFIVDVGSSLGLWLGLSALGITDMTIEAFLVVKKWFEMK